MLINVVEYSQNKSHVAVVRSTKIVVEEINKVRVFGLFSMYEKLV